MSESLTDQELQDKIAELKAKIKNATSIMKSAEYQDELDALTGESARRNVALCSIDNPDCETCSG